MTRAEILQQADANVPVAAIAESAGITPGRIYAILRQERPGRARKPRRRVSHKPATVLALLALGTPPPRVAMLLGCTRAYVYKLRAEHAETSPETAESVDS